MKGLGVALGAGGARGFAHVAVLRRLCAKEMVPSVITGSSMGSVIGSAFALFKDIRTVEKLLGYFVEKSAKNILELTRTLQGKVSLTGKLSAAYKTTATRSMMNEYFLYDLISSIFGKARFSDTKIPLGIVATDAQTGKKELFDYGFISDAVCASSAVPGAFAPVPLAGSHYVDGGVTRVVPVEEAFRLGAKTVIGVDVSYVPKKQRFENIFDLIAHVDDLKGERLVKMDMERAQLAIYFDSLDIEWFRFDRVDEIIEKSDKILSDIYEKEIDRLSLI